MLDSPPYSVPLRNDDADRVVQEFLSDLLSCVPVLIARDLRLSAIPITHPLGLVSASSSLAENSRAIPKLPVVCAGSRVGTVNRVVELGSTTQGRQPSSYSHSARRKETSYAGVSEAVARENGLTERAFTFPSRKPTTESTNTTKPTVSKSPSIITQTARVVTTTGTDESDEAKKAATVLSVGTHHGQLQVGNTFV